MKTNMKTQNHIITALLLFLLPIGVIMLKNLDNDTWFMLNHGRYILANGLYPQYEPFTVNTELHFTFQKWLACILYWAIYKTTGALGLKAFTAIIYCAFNLSLYKLVNYLTKNSCKVRNAIIIGFSNILMYSFYDVRPQVFTYLFLVIEIYCLEKFIKEKKAKYLAVIPVLSLLEIQLHSTIWPIMLIFMLPYMFDISSSKLISRLVFIEKREYNRLFIWIVFCVSILVALINPYGFESIVYLVKSLTIPELKATIPEVRRPDLISFSTVSILAFGVLALIGFIKNKKIELRFLFLFGGTMLMAMTSTRQLSFFIIAAVIAIAIQKEYENKQIISFALALFVLIFSVSLSYLSYDSSKTDARQSIVDVVDYLDSIEDNNQNVKVFCNSDPGSYIEFKQFRAYTDTRAEIFSEKINLNKNILRERSDYELGDLSYKDMFSRYDFDYAIVYNFDTQYEDINNDPEIELLYSNDSLSLFKINNL